MSVKAVYAGSFDPLTIGHKDIIERSDFDLTILIGKNNNKVHQKNQVERYQIISSIYRIGRKTSAFRPVI